MQVTDVQVDAGCSKSGLSARTAGLFGSRILDIRGIAHLQHNMDAAIFTEGGPNDMLMTAGFWAHAAAGVAIGVLNGLFGAGGGIVAVLFLSKLDRDVKMAHATSILITLCLSAASAWLYLSGGHVTLQDALPYLPGGIIGAAAGAIFLKKIPVFWLRKLFAVFILYAAGRLLLQ